MRRLLIIIAAVQTAMSPAWGAALGANWAVGQDPFHVNASANGDIGAFKRRAAFDHSANGLDDRAMSDHAKMMDPAAWAGDMTRPLKRHSVLFAGMAPSAANSILQLSDVFTPNIGFMSFIAFGKSTYFMPDSLHVAVRRAGIGAPFALMLAELTICVAPCHQVQGPGIEPVAPDAWLLARAESPCSIQLMCRCNSKPCLSMQA